MTAVTFYFQVHQPYRLRPYRREDVGRSHRYFHDAENRRLLRRVAERCYLPMNALIRRLIDRTDGRFRCAYSLTGTAIQQMRDWAPGALQSFVDLSETGCVEFLAETSHHSLAFVEDRSEFESQIQEHTLLVEDLFGSRPTTFRNTELVVSNDIARTVERLGFDTLLGEGADRLLGSRSPHRIYRPKGCKRLKLLLRNYVFSDDIAFRFSNRSWPHHPLFADTFASWLHEVPEEDAFIGLFMDYETFGEHQWRETGIFEFMEHLPGYVLENPRFRFATPAEVAAAHDPVGEIDAPEPVSWADQERDLSAWLGNAMQREAHAALYRIRSDVQRAAARGRPGIMRAWRRLTTSDHVYWMCTKFHSDGDVHEYFSPYLSPHDAFVRFMNVLDDLTARAHRALERRSPPRPRKKTR